MGRGERHIGAGSVVVLTALLALLLALTAAAPAVAAAPSGSASLVVKAGKWALLKQRGVALEAVGASSNTGRRLRLQVGGGTIGVDNAQIDFAGALRLSAGEGRSRRVIRLGGLRADLGSGSTLSAQFGKKRRILFDLAGGTLATDAVKGSAQLEGASLVWRRGARVALESRLNKSLPAGLGSFSLSVATVGGGSAPKVEPIANEPPLLARPAGAVNVTSATLAWHVRDSWIRYVNTQEAPQAMEGAGPQAPIPGESHPCPDSKGTPTLVYSYDFPFANGWYDPANGSAALYYGGGVRFSYPSHGIDLTTRNPEIEIAGPASRAIFRLRGAGDTPYPDQRAAIFDLVPTEPLPGAPGSFGFPGPIEASLSADGQKAFAGFYPPPNNGFGCFSVSFSTS